MVARNKRITVKQQALDVLAVHNAAACVLVTLAVAVALVGLFAFIVFSGFGSSADFIYNQF